MDKSVTSAMFGILLALTSAERHGLGIIEEFERRTGGDMAIGTLYRSIARMSEAGLIVPSRRRPAAADDDPRRIYYRITERGRRALQRDTERLDRLVKWARDLRASPRLA
jgi:DNA-binding PadR family transcriptional regulator